MSRKWRGEKCGHGGEENVAANNGRNETWRHGIEKHEKCGVLMK
jgi:hypothetical protein